MTNSDHLRRSIAAKRRRGRFGRAIGILGPGLITGTADDDPAGIVTDTQAGAQFGYGLAWTALLQFPLLSALQLMVARIGLVTGHDLMHVLAARYPRWLLWAAAALFFVANTFTAGADLAGVATGLQLISGISPRWIVVPLTLSMAVSLVFGTYRHIAATMKWLAWALFAYVAAAILAMPRWIDVLHQTIAPRVPFSHGYLTMLVAVFGGTISPYMLVWQSAQEVEELRAAHKKPLSERPWAARTELSRTRQDTIFGMAVSQLIEYFIFIAAGTVIFPTGLRKIETAQQAAAALSPIGRGAGQVLFAIGMVGTGLIAVPTLTLSSAYAIGAAANWSVGSGRSGHRTTAFNVIFILGLLIAGTIAMTGENAMQLLVASQVLNGLLAPLFLVLVLLVTNNRAIMGARTNGWAANALGILATIIMSGAGLWLVISWAMDRIAS